jgi:hypothetical protein
LPFIKIFLPLSMLPWLPPEANAADAANSVATVDTFVMRCIRTLPPNQLLIRNKQFASYFARLTPFNFLSTGLTQPFTTQQAHKRLLAFFHHHAGNDKRHNGRDDVNNQNCCINTHFHSPPKTELKQSSKISGPV